MHRYMQPFLMTSQLGEWLVWGHPEVCGQKHLVFKWYVSRGHMCENVILIQKNDTN